VKAKIEPWDESILDVEDYQVERALTNAALTAIHRARQFGTDFVIEEDGQTKSLRQMKPRHMRSDFLKTWSALSAKLQNCRIAGSKANALELNERAEKPKNK